MTLLKSADADRLVANPDPKRRLVLFFGPDPGGVSERAATLTKRLVGDDPFAIVRIDADELSADPGRIADEAYGASLFAGRRVIRVRALGNRSIAPALEPLIERPPEDTWVIVEAGDLRKTAPLRKQFEGAANAAAIGCYPDSDATLRRLIDDEVKAAGLSISPEAREMLAELIGADRSASRAEIHKLTLYARGKTSIEARDVATLIGDAAAIGVDDAVGAVVRGDLDEVDRSIRRLLADGTSASTIILAAERYFLFLHRTAAQIEAGGSISSVLQSMRPPPLPSRRASLERELRMWSRADLDGALTRINQAVTDSRNMPVVGPSILLMALLSLGRRAAGLARAGGR
ncbi:MAG: DNA polymerase III subunit delta [Bauldia sp.]